jgi:hypothetical protein
MSNPEFEPRPSTYYLVLMTIISICSLCILGCLPVTWLMKLGLVVLLCIYIGLIVWQHGLLRSQNAIFRIKRLENGKWLLQTREKVYEGRIDCSSTITRWVMILRFAIPDCYGFKSCIIFCDSLDKNQFRELIVRTRMY